VRQRLQLEDNSKALDPAFRRMAAPVPDAGNASGINDGDVGGRAGQLRGRCSASAEAVGGGWWAMPIRRRSGLSMGIVGSGDQAGLPARSLRVVAARRLDPLAFAAQGLRGIAGTRLRSGQVNPNCSGNLAGPPVRRDLARSTRVSWVHELAAPRCRLRPRQPCASAGGPVQTPRSGKRA